MDKERGGTYLRQWRVYEELLAGRSMRLSDYQSLARDEGVTMKTIGRDLEMWTKLPFFGVTTRYYDGVRRWQCSSLPKRLEGWSGSVPLTKYCRMCGKIKEREDFPTDRSKGDSKRSICKQCESERKKKHYRENLERSRKMARLASRRYRKRRKEKDAL